MMAGGNLFKFLLLVGFCLQSVYMEQRRVLEQRKPFFERFRRLEEQFRRFQEMTLTRLQGIAENYNISYNIDARFHHLTDQHHSLAESLNASSDMTQQELNGVKFWLKKVQKKTKKLDLKISALEGAMADRNKQLTKENKAQDMAMANFTTMLNNQKRIVYQLMKDKGDLQKGIEAFQKTIDIQGRKITELEKQLQNMQQNEILPPSSLMAPEINRTPEEKQPDPQNDPDPITVQQRMLKLQTKHNQRKKFHEEQLLLIPSKKIEPMAAQQGEVTRKLGPPEEKMSDVQTTKMPLVTMGLQPNQRTSLPKSQQSFAPVTDNVIQISAQRSSVGRDIRPPGDVIQSLPSTRKPLRATSAPKTEKNTKTPATICNVHSMLIFPNSSMENYVTFTKGLREPLHELSVCSWVKTDVGYLGTILSYATEDNDNKFVLHGRNGAIYDAFHFVIGDPAFRELPLVPLIDGKWHHTCLIWSSIQGKYWFYVDRRLTSTGSRFQKGYEIPPGGSMVLGQEQDTMGGGFDSSEAFVGSLAGFAIWNRALSPGEVSAIATGKGLPKGTILTLENYPLIHGAVERVDCTCLENCP